MTNIFVPQARVLSREFNAGVQGLLVGSNGVLFAFLTNWTIGFAERIHVLGHPKSMAGALGTLFAYADEGSYIIENIRMHTRYSNINKAGDMPVAPVLNSFKTVGGICGYANKSTLFITNMVMDF